jgi:hypothetical protein
LILLDECLIGLFYVIMKTETDEKIMIPNNLFFTKKQQNKFRKIIAVILLLCFLSIINKSFRVDILESDNYVYLITLLIK